MLMTMSHDMSGRKDFENNEIQLSKDDCGVEGEAMYCD